MANFETIYKKAALLNPQDKFMLIDELLRTLDKPDARIDAVWQQEAEKRLTAHREGRTNGIPYEEIFGE